MPDRPLTIVGMPGSPYSRKLRAVLRYRRIPHVWVLAQSPQAAGLPPPRVPLLPQLVLDGESRTDSTPLVRELESRWAGRAVVHPDPALAFVDALIEDYADEWLTKAMFHYRWAFAADVEHAARLLPRWSRTTLAESQATAFGRSFAERQIGRLAVVGSNAVTAPVIEASYRRLLALLDARLGASPFVMGGRPGASDFALYGQLTQLAGFDPTPRAIAVDCAPRVVAWVDVVDDLSGLEPTDAEWLDDDGAAAALRPFLTEVGAVYAPFLLANAAALARGADTVEATVAGARWVQKPFPYQAKCLTVLRAAYATLDGGAKRRVDALLAGTGCEVLFRA